MKLEKYKKYKYMMHPYKLTSYETAKNNDSIPRGIVLLYS